MMDRHHHDTGLELGKPVIWTTEKRRRTGWTGFGPAPGVQPHPVKVFDAYATVYVWPVNDLEPERHTS